MHEYCDYFDSLPTPCYVVDERLLKKNLMLLKKIQDDTSCKIILAQKGFSMHPLYPLISQYLAGSTASSLFEAKLAYEHFEGENHIFSPAYSEGEFEEITDICSHIVFNSFSQFKKYRGYILESPFHISCGIRVNPEYSEIETLVYNPCAPRSRFGVTAKSFEPDELTGIEGLHFHTMCEQNSDVLWRTLDHFERGFGAYIERMRWINFGGGHHITRPDYDLEALYRSIERIRDRYGVEIYLEPGEAIALNTGYLAASVLDTLHNEMDIAILDASAACHMPDVLEMPYRPEIIGAAQAGKKRYTYRLAGPTCLAGDIIGDYSFDRQLKPGDRLIFCDMAHYTMVKNNTFNGVNLPSIAVYRQGEGIKVLKEFGYEDFKGRLG